MANSSSSSSGIGFGGLLQVALIVLKLTKLIMWSWWWVLSPTILGFVVLAAILIFLLVVALKK